jgi:hypothetical protein
MFIVTFPLLRQRVIFSKSDRVKNFKGLVLDWVMSDVEQVVQMKKGDWIHLGNILGAVEAAHCSHCLGNSIANWKLVKASITFEIVKIVVSICGKAITWREIQLMLSRVLEEESSPADWEVLWKALLLFFLDSLGLANNCNWQVIDDVSDLVPKINFRLEAR